MQTPRPSSLLHSRNELLQCLPHDEMAKLSPHFIRVTLKSRRVLHYHNTPMEHAYFIEDGLVSVLAHTGPGKSAEVWVIGSEGLVGVPLVLGESVSTHRRVVQVAGSALRIRAVHLREAIDRSRRLRDLLLQYVQTVLVQTSQMAGCNAQHDIQQRLARWLLMAQDRCKTDALPLTHDMLSRMLGVRRATVSECIAELERQEIVGRARSLIRVNSRRRLEAIACQCYRIIRSADLRLKRHYRSTEDSRRS